MIFKFKSLGHQVSHLPLLTIEKINYDEINFFDYGDDFTPVLFTGFLAWLFYFLYKRSSMIKLVTKTAGGSAMGINIRKGDKTVSEEDYPDNTNRRTKH